MSLVAGSGTNASLDYIGIASAAKLGSPSGVAIDGAENLYVVDRASRSVRVVASGEGAIPTLPFVRGPIAGTLYTLASNGLVDPRSVAVDHNGNIYVADRADNTVKVIYAGGALSVGVSRPAIGTLYNIAGISGQAGIGSEGASARASLLNDPEGVAVDTRGNLYIADTGNNRVRVVYAGGAVVGVPAGAAAGDIYTVAGNWQSICTQSMNLASQCGMVELPQQRY